LTTRFL